MMDVIIGLDMTDSLGRLVQTVLLYFKLSYSNVCTRKGPRHCAYIKMLRSHGSHGKVGTMHTYCISGYMRGVTESITPYP